MFNVELIKKIIEKKGEDVNTISHKLNIPLIEINNMLDDCGEIEIANFIKIAKFLEENPSNLIKFN